MRGWGVSRRALYQQLDQPALVRLPAVPYEYAECHQPVHSTIMHPRARRRRERKGTFSNPEVVLAGGPSSPEYEAEPPKWLEDLWEEREGRRMLGALSLIDSGRRVRTEDPVYVWGLNLSIRKGAFESCGGFHPDCIPTALQRYQGDGETGLALKVKAAGFCTLYHPDVAVKHVIPATRMTLKSFEQRGFYQGVCDSYTEIRRQRRVPTPTWPSWRDLVRPAEWEVERELTARRPSAEGVRKLMARSHFAGLQFHRNEVRNDPKLLDWVLREDYFDYRLPTGWEQYLDVAPYHGATPLG
jgi:hypothetical protein